VEKLAPVQVRTQEEIMNECQWVLLFFFNFQLWKLMFPRYFEVIQFVWKHTITLTPYWLYRKRIVAKINSEFKRNVST
jgi:hypothetical protein